ncbi:MAG: tyrosine recombinase XerS [Bacillus sp. (in: firmicutes)]
MDTKQHKRHKEKLDEMVLTMPFYVVEYIDDKLDTRSPSTLLNYLHDYKMFFEWLIAEDIAKCETIKDIPLETLEHLELDQAKSFFKFLQREDIQVSKKEKKKREKVSISRKISALRSLFSYLTTQTEIKEGNKKGEPYFYRNVMLKVEVTKVKETLSSRASRMSGKIFHDDDDVKFIDFLKNGYEHCFTPGSKQLSYFKRDKLRDIAICSLFLGSGIRVNELANLRLQDLDFKYSEINVIRKGGKKDTVAVTPPAMADLSVYLEVRNQIYNATDDETEYLFVSKRNNVPTPLSNEAIARLVKKYTKAFQGNKSISPHKLRHTYGTKLMEQENDIHLVMSQLGHTSTTTAALYVNPEKEKARQAAARMGNRNKNKE